MSIHLDEALSHSVRAFSIFFLLTRAAFLAMYLVVFHFEERSRRIVKV